MDESTGLEGAEKTFVALAAAMGGGCRTCAERLFAIAQSLAMNVEDIDRAFGEGLEVREVSTRLMRETARSLHRGEGEPGHSRVSDRGARIDELARLAAAVAANAGPAALAYAEAARLAGASEAAIGVAIGIGRTIRGKAQAFSDEEVGGPGVVAEETRFSPAGAGKCAGAPRSDETRGRNATPQGPSASCCP